MGNLVLLHDSGGDRSSTVAALPAIIDGLMAEGFTLVPVADLIGQSRAATMPVLSPRERWAARVDRLVFDLYHWARVGIATVFVAGITLVSLRALLLGFLALVEKALRRHPPGSAVQPLVSVLVPAHDEEAAIADTVRSALASDYPALKLIVVDDGSKDATAKRALAAAAGDARLLLIRQPNRGKRRPSTTRSPRPAARSWRRSTPTPPSIRRRSTASSGTSPTRRSGRSPAT